MKRIKFRGVPMHVGEPIGDGASGMHEFLSWPSGLVWYSTKKPEEIEADLLRRTLALVAGLDPDALVPPTPEFIAESLIPLNNTFTPWKWAMQRNPINGGLEAVGIYWKAASMEVGRLVLHEVMK